MAKKFKIAPTIESYPVKTVILGADKTDLYGFTEIGKPVKLAGDSTYVLCAAGDAIEGIITSSEYATSGGATRGGRSIGGIADNQGYFLVLADEQLAVGDLIVTGTVTPKGTALQNIDGAFNVKKAANANGLFRARIVGLGDAGTGAVGTTCVAEFL